MLYPETLVYIPPPKNIVFWFNFNCNSLKTERLNAISSTTFKMPNTGSMLPQLLKQGIVRYGTADW